MFLQFLSNRSVGLVVILSLFSGLASAQQVHIKDEGDRDEYSSTIEVRKKNHISSDLNYRIEDGHEKIDGDAAPLLQDARKKWKKACDDWKKEFRDNNVGNKVISTSCGSMKCDTQAMETTCRSEATYKVRVKMTNDDQD